MLKILLADFADLLQEGWARYLTLLWLVAVILIAVYGDAIVEVYTPLMSLTALAFVIHDALVLVFEHLRQKSDYQRAEHPAAEHQPNQTDYHPKAG